MTIGRRPACFECVHLHTGDPGTLTCDAFPQGIPDPIYFEGVDHRQPFPGDHGIRWEPKPGVDGYPPELQPPG
jgi:hypothetical protein